MTMGLFDHVLWFSESINSLLTRALWMLNLFMNMGLFDPMYYGFPNLVLKMLTLYERERCGC